MREGSDNDRGMMNTLCNHCNGPGEITKRHNKAKESSIHLHHRNKMVFPCSKFVSQLTKAFIAHEKAGRPLDAQTKMDHSMDKTQPMELAAAKEVACDAHPNDFAAAADHIGERVNETFSAAVRNRACLQSSHGRGSVPLAQLVAVLATEVEEEAVEAVVMGKETAEAVVALGMLPAVIVCLSMELTSLIHSAASPQTNGIDLAAMAGNWFSACTTMPTVNKLGAVKEETGAAQLRPWKPRFKPSRWLPLLPHRLVRSPLTRPMQIRLVLALDLAVVSTNGDTVVIPDNHWIHLIDRATGMCPKSRFQMFQAMLFRTGESMKHLVEQSMNYPFLSPLVEMKLAALLTLLVQVGIGSCVFHRRHSQCLWSQWSPTGLCHSCGLLCHKDCH